MIVQLWDFCHYPSVIAISIDHQLFSVLCFQGHSRFTALLLLPLLLVVFSLILTTGLGTEVHTSLLRTSHLVARTLHPYSSLPPPHQAGLQCSSWWCSESQDTWSTAPRHALISMKVWGTNVSCFKPLRFWLYRLLWHNLDTYWNWYQAVENYH